MTASDLREFKRLRRLGKPGRAREGTQRLHRRLRHRHYAEIAVRDMERRQAQLREHTPLLPESATVREMMSRYDEARAAWEAQRGHDDESAFHVWYTAQVGETT